MRGINTHVFRGYIRSVAADGFQHLKTAMSTESYSNSGLGTPGYGPLWPGVRAHVVFLRGIH